MIKKSANNTNNFSRKITFANAARDCWLGILESFERKPKVLLPAYIGVTDREGSGIFDPIQTLNLEYGFYPLEDDLKIDKLKLKAIINDLDYDVILLVHYFGLQIPEIEDIISICKKRDLIVVEDCAHLYNYNLHFRSKGGTFGDYSFYSLHKNFPIDNGGLLIQNNKSLKPPVLRKEIIEDYAEFVLRYDADEIATKRIDNYKLYEESLHGIEGVHKLRKLNNGDIPHNFPILVDNGLRESLYFWLMDNGIPLIALYYRLIDPLKNNNKFRNMQALSDSILNLPVHQDTTLKDIQIITDMIKKGLKELKS